MPVLDFPANPSVGQNYTATTGAVYSWNGVAWVTGYYNSPTQLLSTVGDVLDQIRTLLQDVDTGGGQYRYSTDSIIQNINQGLIELYRARPDIFLELDFVVPQYSDTDLSETIGIEEQYIPALVYYGVGMTQLRDDEGTQDARSALFLQRFAQIAGATI